MRQGCYVGCSHSIQSEEPLRRQRWHTAVRDERLRERLIVCYASTGKWACQRDRFCFLETEAAKREVDGILRELPKCRELATDDGEEALNALVSVVVDDVTAWNLPFRHPGRVGQWPHSAIGVQNITGGEFRSRHKSVHLVQEVVDLRLFCAGGIRFLVIEVVGAPDEVPVHPRYDQNQAAISLRLVIHDVVRCSGERCHDDVAAFGATDESGCLDSPDIGKQAVDPWAGGIHDHAPVHGMPLSRDGVGVLHAGHSGTVPEQPIDSGVGDDVGSVSLCGYREFNTEPLCVFDLSVDEDRRTGEAGRLHPGEARQHRAFRQNRVVRLLLIP